MYPRYMVTRQQLGMAVLFLKSRKDDTLSRAFVDSLARLWPFDDNVLDDRDGMEAVLDRVQRDVLVRKLC